MEAGAHLIEERHGAVKEELSVGVRGGGLDIGKNAKVAEIARGAQGGGARVGLILGGELEGDGVAVRCQGVDEAGGEGRCCADRQCGKEERYEAHSERRHMTVRRDARYASGWSTTKVRSQTSDVIGTGIARSAHLCTLSQCQRCIQRLAAKCRDPDMVSAGMPWSSHRLRSFSRRGSFRKSALPRDKLVG